MIDERELWACAVQVLRVNGEDHVGDYLYQRISALTDAQDYKGAEVWIGIADRARRLILSEDNALH